jgi:putative ABC transport system permease protein
MFFYIKPEGKSSPEIESLSYKPEMSVTEADLEYIKRQCPTVKDITAYLFAAVPLRYGGRYHTIKALGLLSPSAARGIWRVESLRGRYLSDLDVETKANVCVIEESKFSRDIFGGRIPVGKTMLIGKDKYKIVGTVKRLVFAFGYPRKLVAILPSSSLQETTGIRKYSAVELAVKNVADVPVARSQLEQAILQRFGYPSEFRTEFRISGYAKFVETALAIGNMLTIIIIGIAIISLSVGGVGIMNVMMTMVTEQTREIGIAKAIGANKNAILFLFLAESIILTMTGGTLGILLGLGASKLVTVAVGIPYIIPPWVIVLGFFLSVVVGVISGSYPAKRAAELDPVETLRVL